MKLAEIRAALPDYRVFADKSNATVFTRTGGDPVARVEKTETGSNVYVNKGKREIRFATLGHTPSQFAKDMKELGVTMTDAQMKIAYKKETVECYEKMQELMVQHLKGKIERHLLTFLTSAGLRVVDIVRDVPSRAKPLPKPLNGKAATIPAPAAPTGRKPKLKAHASDAPESVKATRRPKAKAAPEPEAAPAKPRVRKVAIWSPEDEQLLHEKVQTMAALTKEIQTLQSRRFKAQK